MKKLKNKLHGKKKFKKKLACKKKRLKIHIDWEAVEQKVDEFLNSRSCKSIHLCNDKVEREAAIDALKEEFKVTYSKRN